MSFGQRVRQLRRMRGMNSLPGCCSTSTSRRESRTTRCRVLGLAHGMNPIDAAHRTREVLGFSPDEPLPYIVLAAERGGSPARPPIPDGDNRRVLCMAWPDTRSSDHRGGLRGRVRFTGADELGHLILHRTGHRGKQVEEQADVFAAELPAPRDALLPTLPRNPNLTNPAMVTTQWGVSVKALVRWCRELQVIDADRALSLYKQISKKGWNRKEPGFVPVEKPRGLRKLA